MKKWFILILSVLMMLALPVLAEAESGTEITTWAELQEALSNSGTVTLTQDITAASNDAALTVPEVDVTLNLNGHTINRALTEATANGSVIIIEKGTLTINGSGTITGGNTTGNGGGIYCKDQSELIINSGVTISGNKANSGSGVYVAESAGLTMNGGSIINNTAAYGPGVRLASTSTFTISGAPVIQGNTATGGDHQGLYNLYLESSSTQRCVINVTGSLTNTTNIYVSTEQVPTEDTPVQVTSGLNVNYHFFHSDQTAYKIIGNDGEACLAVIPGDELQNIVYAGITFEPWTDYWAHEVTQGTFDGVRTASNSLPPGYNYYLTEDVDISLNGWTPAGDVNLYLNGHTITVDSHSINPQIDADSVTVSIYEAPGQPGGIINCSSYRTGRIVNVRVGGTFNLYGGYINNNGKGVSVYIYNEWGGPGGTFNMYGGKIINGLIGVSCEGPSSFKMSGGTISDCGTGVWVDRDGTMNMTGGTITGCTETGVIVGNNDESATQVTLNKGTLNMSGGEIINNVSGARGVCLTRGTMTMSGGTISGNSTNIDGAGIYVSPNASLTFSGGSVSGNTQNGEADNIYLSSGKVINIDRTLSAETVINVRSADESPESTVTLTSGLSGKGGLENIHYDNGVYSVRLLENGEAEVFKTTIPYVDAAGNARTPIAVYTPIDAGTTVLAEGWYVVTDDVMNNNRMQAKGDVNLILVDGKTLTVPKGITVNQNNRLTIWGQTGGSGKVLITNTESSSAGIGSGNEYEIKGGTVTVNGGTLDVTGCNGRPAIGGNFTVVNINGGTVTAKGTGSQNGIGVNYGSIAIAGGTVNASSTGNNTGYGIRGSFATVTISGHPKITASGTKDGMDIWGDEGTNLSGSPEINGILHLGSSDIIKIDGPLFNTKPITVSTENYRTGVFTNELREHGGSASNFKLPETGWDGYVIRETDEGEAAILRAFSITLDATLGNDVPDTIFTVDRTLGVAGETVTLTQALDPDYRVTDLKASYGDNQKLTLTQGMGDQANTWTFTMPDSDVTVTAKIDKKHERTITAENVTVTYGETGKSVSARVSAPEAGADIDYVVKEGSGEFIGIDSTTGTLTIKKVPENGKAYVIVTSAETNEYARATKEVIVTISKAPLTVTAKPKTITYGETPMNDGVTYSGFVNSESESNLSGTLTYDYTYEQYGDAGSYAITPSGLTSDNYEISFIAGTLTVAQKEVGLEWGNTLLTFNGSAQAPTATATGMVNSDNITVNVGGGQTNAGTDYTATASGLTGDNAGNYKLPTTGLTQEFSIGKAEAQTLTDVALSKPYVMTNITASVAGTMPSNAGTLSYTAGTAITTGSVTVSDFTVDPDGNLTATLSGGAAADTITLPVTISSTNYDDSTVNVKITLTAKSDAGVNITNVPASKTYGDADFTLTGNVTDAGTGTGVWTWSSSDDSIFQITPNGATATVRILKKGSATVTAWYESDTTVDSETTDTITVNTKTITITAKNQSIYVGGTVPTLSGGDFYTITGLAGKDTLTTAPTLVYQKNGSAATPDNTAAGTYDIVASGANAGDNYTISYTNGMLTISEKPSAAVKKAPTPKTLTYNGSAQELVTAGEAEGGEMQYTLGENAATAPADNLYTTSIPAATNAGTYYVWYKVIGDSNHLDSEPGMVETAIIAPVFGTPNFTLPAGVGTIEANAFEGLKNMNVVDARNCKKIGAEAFKGTGLKQIRLDKDCEIAENAFSGCGTVYVFAQTGGKTKTFCDTHEGIVFVAVE